MHLFLKSVPQYSFKKIIFVDDVEHNLKSVGKVAHALGMTFVGIKFTLEKERIPDPLNLSITKQQLRLLVKEKRWISEEEVCSLNVAKPLFPHMDQIFSCNFPCIKVLTEGIRRDLLLDPFPLQTLSFSLGCAQR